MRIELPLPSWSESQRAQEDAHTLTLPAQRPHALPSPLLASLAAEAPSDHRIAVLASRPATLTLTF